MTSQPDDEQPQQTAEAGGHQFAITLTADGEVIPGPDPAEQDGQAEE
jgi:hypothetical protein